MFKTVFRLLPGVFLGFLLGCGVMAAQRGAGPALQGSSIQTMNASGELGELVRCAADVKTEGWQTFRDDYYAIQFRYPDDYQVIPEKDGLLVEPVDASGTEQWTIKLEKLRGSVASYVDPDMQQGSWKIADRQTYALTTQYYGDAEQGFWSNYLFVRDFPKQASGPYVMIRATIRSPKALPELKRARDSGMVDVDVMTRPEQVLSTFRFMQYDELPNNGYGAKPPKVVDRTVQSSSSIDSQAETDSL